MSQPGPEAISANASANSESKPNHVHVLVEQPDGLFVLGANEAHPSAREPEQAVTNSPASSYVDPFIATQRDVSSDVSGLNLLVVARARATAVMIYLDLLYIGAYTFPVWSNFRHLSLRNGILVGYAVLSILCDVAAVYVTAKPRTAGGLSLRRVSVVCLSQALLLLAGIAMLLPPLIILRLLVVLWALRIRQTLVEMQRLWDRRPPPTGCGAWWHYRMVGRNQLYQGPRPFVPDIEITPVSVLTLPARDTPRRNEGGDAGDATVTPARNSDADEHGSTTASAPRPNADAPLETHMPALPSGPGQNAVDLGRTADAPLASGSDASDGLSFVSCGSLDRAPDGMTNASQLPGECQPRADGASVQGGSSQHRSHNGDSPSAERDDDISRACFDTSVPARGVGYDVVDVVPAVSSQ